jgi:aldehyde dehydrogenase (NAD+)
MPGCNLKLTAKRLTWGKFHNNGMACVSPDQIYVHESIREQLLSEIKKNIKKIFGDDPRHSPALPRVVNEKHFQRIMSMVDTDKVVSGGESDPEDLYIAPTVMDGVQPDDAVMQEEIFGPLMALISYSELDQLVEKLKRQPAPLMLYLFTGNIRKAKRLTREIPSGGAMINDVILQFVNMDTPFGGLGESGMGSYHGKAGFDSFSQQKTVIRKFNVFELFMKYPPYYTIYLPFYRTVLGKSVRNLFR